MTIKPLNPWITLCNMTDIALTSPQSTNCNMKILWHNTLKGTIMPNEYLLPHIVSAEHWAHLERAGHHFWGQPLQKRKGAGLELVLHFTASERDCNGCLRASRAKLACSLRSGSPSLTYGLPRAGEGGGLMSLGARESHRLQIWESAKKTKNNNLEKSNTNTAARPNFNQQPERPGGGVNRSKVLPSTWHWQLVNIWQHASRFQSLLGG